MANKSGNQHIEAVFLLIDLLLINIIFYLFPLDYKNPIITSPYLFHANITIGWIIISIRNSFYAISRNTKTIHLLNKIAYQFTFFFLILYAFIGLFKQPMISRLNLGYYFLICLFVITLIKFATFYLLLFLRGRLNFNISKAVVIGKNRKTQQLIDVLQKNKGLGYLVEKQFDPDRKIFNLVECLKYIEQNQINEIFCSNSQLNSEQISSLIDFSDRNLIKIRFIPDNRNIYSTKLKFEYFDYIPIVSVRVVPLDGKLNKLLKRIFDIIFSFLVIFCLLSWLIPLMAIIIRLESKGPTFFMQLRNGIDNKPFYCYKFRSMTPNKDSEHKWATKNDARITRVGKFIRKTSIDELPQFYNVLFGSMSVVGPRPHPLKLTDDLAEKHNKFMVRHLIKPGITGLAQVKGERGEIETDSDGLNRLRYDLFYVENWSMILDLKIILQTVLNVFKGEEKAY